jgi:S-DNA-T family DNA segregation ATPase FtsK/SpoIIIE
VILLALAVLFFLCLISYSPADWSLNGTGQGNQKTQNWIGVVGAVVSDLLFQFVGLIAYVFPALLALIAWRVFYAESLMPRVSRIIGFLLLLISAPALIDLINLGDGGGMIGAGFARFFIYLLSPIGAGILLFTLLTASILLLTNFSFFGFFGNFDVAWANFRIHFDEWLAKKREKREANRAAESERLETLQTMHGDKSINTAAGRRNISTHNRRL